ncbi:unnamed protein product, partial [Thelazia callipaeda]|uniref:ShKT domain-containing protein n=1 Tax=Thelazia callipaeda TaxID=103827 RepID=A0A0N5CQG9_THECL
KISIKKCKIFCQKNAKFSCSETKYLCNNSLYYDLMTEQCPKTCDRCFPFCDVYGSCPTNYHCNMANNICYPNNSNISAYHYPSLSITFFSIIYAFVKLNL